MNYPRIALVSLTSFAAGAPLAAAIILPAPAPASAGRVTKNARPARALTLGGAGVAECGISSSLRPLCTAIPADAGERLRRLLDAIRMTESGGKQHPRAGDSGKSIGRFQIQSAYWRDATEYGGVKWDWRTGAWDDAKAERVILWYAARYGAKTPEEIARCHNGGSQWRTRARAATAAYWSKVQQAMKGF